MESVLPVKRLTAEELHVLPDDGQRHELVEGFLLAEPPAAFRHGTAAARIFARLNDFVRVHQLGVVVSADTGFLLARSPDTVRAPDVAFVSAQRLRKAGDIPVYFPGPPDIVVEVLSAGDRTGEVHGKVGDYLAAGSALVWVLDPAGRSVRVYRSLLCPRTVGEKDDLDGEEVLPGFRVRVGELFED